MDRLVETEPAKGRTVGPGEARPEDCPFCGTLATAACPACDARRGHPWARSAPDPELEEYPYPS